MAKKTGDKPELLTKDEMDRLINVVSGDLYFTTLYKVLKYSGRRIGEIYGTYRDGKLIGGVRLKDIDFDNKTMKTQILKTKKQKSKIRCPKCDGKVNKKVKFCPECGSPIPQTKEEKNYSVEKKYMPLRDEVINILKVYIENHKPKFKQNDYIFRKYSLPYLKKKIKRDCKRASINKNFSLHGFRHYFISMCKKQGLSNDQVAKWTGHTSTQTIDIYNQLVPEDVREKIEGVEL